MEYSFWFGTMILGRSIVYIEGSHVKIQKDFEVLNLKKSKMEYIFLLLLLEVNNYEMIKKKALPWDFQQCGMCDQQSLRSACAYAQSDQRLC